MPQIAALPRVLRYSNGQPTPEGWAHLKRGRKQAMFMEIIGMPRRPVVPIASLRKGGKRHRPPAEAQLQRGSAAQPRADILQIPGSAGVAPSSPADEKPTRLDFMGKLDAADDIAVTFRLASQGELRPHPPTSATERSRLSSKEVERAVRLWAGGLNDLGRLSLWQRRHHLCQAPMREFSGTAVGPPQGVCGLGERLRSAGKGAEAGRQNAQIPHGE